MSIATEHKEAMESIELALKEIFREIFEVSEVRDEDSIETTPLWDSLGHMELMAALEQTFNIRIEPEDIINLTSVTALKEYLKVRL